MWVLEVMVFYAWFLFWESVLRSLSLVFKAILLMLLLSLLMSIGMQTLLSELYVIIKGGVLLCNVSL